MEQSAAGSVSSVLEMPALLTAKIRDGLFSPHGGEERRCVCPQLPVESFSSTCQSQPPPAWELHFLCRRLGYSRPRKSAYVLPPVHLSTALACI